MVRKEKVKPSSFFSGQLTHLGKLTRWEKMVINSLTSRQLHGFQYIDGVVISILLTKEHCETTIVVDPTDESCANYEMVWDVKNECWSIMEDGNG